jgi:polysaccharide biosynthesis transport protein
MGRRYWGGDLSLGMESNDLTIAGSDKAGRRLLVPPEYDPPVRSLPEILSENLRIVRKRKATIIMAGFLGLLAGFLYTLPKPPVYRSSASIEVQTPNDDFAYSRDINPTSSQGSMFPDYDMATQIRILSTKSLLDRVVVKLNGDSNLRIQVPEDRFSAWRKALRLPPSPVTPRRDVIEATAASFIVQSARGARVIDIRSESVDANLAAVFVNTMAQEYIEQAIERRWQAAQHTGQWLERQLDDIKIKLEKSEDQLQGYATAQNLVFTGDGDGNKDKTNVADEKLSELQRELSAAQADRILKQARYELAGAGRSDSMAQVLDDSSLRTNELKLEDLRRELADETQTFGPAHVRVKKLQAQIAQTESDQKKTRDKIVERISNDFREAQRREKLLSADYQAQSAVLSDQAGKITHYNILKREVDINRQLYESLLQKVKESGISAALRASNLQIIDAAQPPLAPSGPDLRFASVCGLLLGLTGGIGFVSVSERMSTFIVAPGDASFHLGLTELGLIPSYSIDKSAAKNMALPLAAPNSEPPLPSIPPRKSHSLTAEAFRALLTSILYVGRKRRSNVLIIASPGPGEGKTTVVSNLALAFAETSRSVLIIDCDTRKPKLHRIFDVPNDTGLLEILAQKEPLDPVEIFRHWKITQFPGVCIVPSGQETESAQALLHSERLRELLALARSQFDVVLIDTPPMMHLADARIVGALVDGVVLVLRSGQTSRESAVSVRSRLQEDGIPVFGVVLNDWNPKAAGYYGYENYAHYYKSYYGKKN